MPARRIDPSRYRDPGLLGTLVQQTRLVWRLFNDSRVPAGLKLLLPAVLAAYLLWPVDLVPDFLLGLGQLDDLGVLLAAVALFVRWAPAAVVEEHRAALEGRLAGRPAPAASTGRPATGTGQGQAGRVVEAEYRVGERR